MGGRVVGISSDDEGIVYESPAAVELSEPERATEDLLIERTDLGRGAHTLVRGGDLIPVELAEMPRVPGSGAQAEKARPPKRRARKAAATVSDGAKVATSKGRARRSDSQA